MVGFHTVRTSCHLPLLLYQLQSHKTQSRSKFLFLHLRPDSRSRVFCLVLLILTPEFRSLRCRRWYLGVEVWYVIFSCPFGAIYALFVLFSEP